MKVQSRELISERIIGKGISSIVYETTWRGESYARKDFLGVPKDIFEEEAKALVDLDYHENVVRAYCWTVDEESCSLVTELMDDDLHSLVQRRKAAGRKKLNPGSGSSHVIDLQQFMEDRKKASVATSSESVASPPIYPFSMPDALDIIKQIAQGMMFLHDNGVVHGDLKPKNVFVTSWLDRFNQFLSFDVKVADFGLLGTKTKSRALVSRQARKLDMVRWRAGELVNLSFLRQDEDDSSTDSDWDSDSGEGESSVVHKYKVPTKYSDVYSFGLTCSQILTGEDPYSGLGLNDLVKNKLDPDGLRPELPPTCPIRLRKLIESCWSVKGGRPSFDTILIEMQNPYIRQVSSKRSTDSGKSSGRPGGSRNLSPSPEENIGVPPGHKKRKPEDISTEPTFPTIGLQDPWQSEMPSSKIEVQLQLTKPVWTILGELERTLQEYNMYVSLNYHDDHNIIVGAPENAFDAKSVLAIVKKCDNDARIIE